MMPNILLSDCMCMHKLIQSHLKWNSGVDWFVGSPTYGQAEYRLCDHEVTMRTSLLTLTVNHHVKELSYGKPIRLIQLNIDHVDLLLEARWQYIRESGYVNLDHEHLEYVIWEGDAWLFTEWLTEFQLRNSLTANPITC